LTAELDFIAPGYGSDPWNPNGSRYSVIWPRVFYYDDCSHTQTFNDGRTYELLYRGATDKTNVNRIITTTSDDKQLYGWTDGGSPSSGRTTSGPG